MNSYKNKIGQLVEMTIPLRKIISDEERRALINAANKPEHVSVKRSGIYIPS
jgi:hypothetical protein